MRRIFASAVSSSGLMGQPAQPTTRKDFRARAQSTRAGPDAVVISIAPHNFSTGMFSWFPLYFPLRAPLHVPARPDGAGGGAAASTALDVHLWRCASPSKVWYEWAAALPQTRAMTPIHNPNGRSYWIGL